MRTFHLLGIALMTILPSTAKSESLPCNRPDFRGEVWAAEVTSPKGNLVTIYWVFEKDGFHEYLHFSNTGKTIHLGSGRYTKLADSYVIKAGPPHQRLVSRVEARSDTIIESADAVEVFFDQTSLQLPTGQRLARLTSADQSLPWLGRAPSTTVTERTTAVEMASCDCCGLCFAVHDFLGIGYLDGICCFWDGGCAGGFCGGGGSGGGGGSSGNW